MRSGSRRRSELPHDCPDFLIQLTWQNYLRGLLSVKANPRERERGFSVLYVGLLQRARLRSPRCIRRVSVVPVLLVALHLHNK